MRSLSEFRESQMRNPEFEREYNAIQQEMCQYLKKIHLKYIHTNTIILKSKNSVMKVFNMSESAFL